MVREYHFVLSGSTLVSENGNYSVGVYLNQVPVEIKFAQNVLLDFERLYRQDLRSVSQFGVGLALHENRSGLCGQVDSLDEIIYPISFLND